MTTRGGFQKNSFPIDIHVKFNLATKISSLYFDKKLIWSELEYDKYVEI